MMKVSTNGPVDAVVDRRFVALVDDADGHEQLARAHAEPAVDEEIEVRLFELQLAFLFAAFDDRVLDFELRDESDPIREAMGEQQDEAPEVDERVARWTGSRTAGPCSPTARTGGRPGGPSIRWTGREPGTRRGRPERGRSRRVGFKLCRSTSRE